MKFLIVSVKADSGWAEWVRQRIESLGYASRHAPYDFDAQPELDEYVLVIVSANIPPRSPAVMCYMATATIIPVTVPGHGRLPEFLATRLPISLDEYPDATKSTAERFADAIEQLATTRGVPVTPPPFPGDRK